jgi:hypothetical protein
MKIDNTETKPQKPILLRRIHATDKIPQLGQFVAVWETLDGKPWSLVYRWQGSELNYFEHGDYCWRQADKHDLPKDEPGFTINHHYII